MLAEYLGHPDFQPTGQDRSFTETKVGLGAVYLTLGLRAQERADADTETALAKMSQHFLDQQEANGSWKLKSSQPPLVDGDDVTTMMLLLALGPQSDTDGEAPRPSLKWLKESDHRQETQPMAMRAIVSAMYGTPEDSEQVVTQLFAKQNDDGGWAQTKDRDSDALATGEALYALSMVNGNHHEEAVHKALEFLISTQQDDGSWLVHTRNPKGHDEIVTYYGTGWATIGIVRSLPK
jgi:squalene-hopene/tetraprenyl-beta-curcumene cyclase